MINLDEFKGFYKKSIDERLNILKSKVSLTEEEAKMLKNSGALSLDVADRMIENVIGVVHLPVGLGMNFLINGKYVIIPMAVEEPSIIAGASYAAKLCLPEGFTADTDEPIMVGQIQIVNVENIDEAISKINQSKEQLLQICREHSKGIEQFGGGTKDLEVRYLDSIRGRMLIVEVSIDVRDAMGANTINTVLEKLAPCLVDLVGGKIRLRILTNLATKRKVRASAIWKKGIIGEEVIEGVLDGYAFAKADIFRCSTNNKGIFNGVDAVALATGNDWRAVEAGGHAFAAMNGYVPLASYEKTPEGDIKGSIELPLSVGTVGGAINTKPTAKLMLKLMGVKKAQELSMAMACVGLANNFAALRALSTEGSQKGHMKLHAKNVAVIAGAKTPAEIDALSLILAKENNFSVDFAKKNLEEIRK